MQSFQAIANGLNNEKTLRKLYTIYLKPIKKTLKIYKDLIKAANTLIIQI